MYRYAVLSFQAVNIVLYNHEYFRYVSGSSVLSTVRVTVSVWSIGVDKQGVPKQMEHYKSIVA